MSLTTRITRLERRWGGPGCPGCGWATAVGPVTFSIRTHDDDDDGPTHCEVCGRPLVFTMVLSDEGALDRDATRWTSAART